MKLPKTINLKEVSKEAGNTIHELFLTAKYLEEISKPGVSGMNLDGVKHRPQHPPMPGISTKKYRNIHRRMLDKVKDQIRGSLNQVDSEYVPPVSKRCRLKDCSLKDRRQRDAKFCRSCGNELKN